MDTLRQDLRSAFRSARRAPGSTAVIVLSIALGIGACTAVFCVVWALLLRPLPFRQAAELQAIEAIPPGGPITDNSSLISVADFADLRAESRAFSEVAAYFNNFGLTLTGGGEPERVTAALVSAQLLPLFGVEPLLGRQIRAEEDRPGAAPVVLLGYGLWQRRFGGDPGIVGKTIQANFEPYRVVGVMPPGFAFPIGNEAWVALGFQTGAVSPRSLRRYEVVGRLRPGATLEAARRDTAAIARRLAARHPADKGWGLGVSPLQRAQIGGGLRHSVLAVLTAVVSVLLLACANIADLLLARALERRGEIALRAALGASPGRIARQLLTESLALALAGGALGLPLGIAGVRLLRGSLPHLPYGYAVTADLPALAAALAATVLAGLLCGLSPALQARRPDLRQMVRSGRAPGRGSSRLHASLIVTEAALATVLLISASLATRSFAALQAETAGMTPHRILTVWVQLAGARHRAAEERGRTVHALAARVAAAPGIEAAAGANFVPFSVNNGDTGRIEEAEDAAPGGERIAFCSAVTSGFFRALGTPLLAGRDLTAEEGSTQSAAAVINATLARSLWPAGGAVGRRLRIDGTVVNGWLTVVGVAGDLKTHSLREESRPQVYVSAAYNRYRPAALLVRTGLPRERALSAVRRAVHAADPDVPVFSAATLDELRAEQLRVERLSSGGLTLFGAAALFLAAIGTYGVLAAAVARGRREIAIRLALGAPRGALVRRLIGRGIALTAAGLTLGLVAGLAVSHALAGQLFGVTPTDPVSFAGTGILLLDVAFIACWLPARRALEADPADVLRQE